MYNLLIYTYGLGVRLSALYSKKAQLWLQGRTNWDVKLRLLIGGHKNWIWFHCASLGEFEDGRVIIEEIKKRYPHYHILITFFSPSGYEAKKNNSDVDAIFYLPQDTFFNAKLFVEILKPQLAVFVRNDIWMNYLKALKKNYIPAVLLSLNMNTKSKFIKWPQRNFYKKVFNCFDKIIVQNKLTAELVNNNFKITDSFVSGNLRTNNICKMFDQRILLSAIERFVSGDFCIVAGSSLLREEELFLKAYHQSAGKKIKWIIAPHEINSDMIDDMVYRNKRMTRYSEINKLNPAHDFLWIDNVGMLSKIYRYADVAFIGGGFNRIGIHNILEPAVYGCPIAFGPNHRNYPEALELIESGGAEIIKNQAGLDGFVNKFYNDRELLMQLKKKNSEYVFKKKGDVQSVLNVFNELLIEE
jgi:3-deoxy-D-manno-octulosonic-acid transferase